MSAFRVALLPLLVRGPRRALSQDGQLVPVRKYRVFMIGKPNGLTNRILKAWRDQRLVIVGDADLEFLKALITETEYRQSVRREESGCILVESKNNVRLTLTWVGALETIGVSRKGLFSRVAEWMHAAPPEDPAEHVQSCQSRTAMHLTLFGLCLGFAGICSAFAVWGLVDHYWAAAAPANTSKVVPSAIYWTVRWNALLAVLLAVLAPVFKARARDWQTRLDDAEFDRDLQELKADQFPASSKADRLWRMNQRQIKRYHEANLHLNSWAFAVGVGCMLLGVAVIVVTLRYLNSGQSEKTATAVTGLVGAVLTNVVAAIFLKMHAASTLNFSNFYETLAQAQRLFLANILATQVDDSPRSEIFSELARAIVGAASNGRGVEDSGSNGMKTLGADAQGGLEGHAS